MNQSLMNVKRIFKPAFLLLLLCSITHGYAVVETYVGATKSLKTFPLPIVPPATSAPLFSECYDSKKITTLPFAGYGGAWANDFSFKYINNSIQVSIDRAGTGFVGSAKNIRVKLIVWAKNANGADIIGNASNTTANVTLDLIYNPEKGVIENDKAIYAFQNAVWFKATVAEITDFNGLIISPMGTNLPDVKLETKTEFDRVYRMDMLSTSSSGYLAFASSVMLPPLMLYNSSACKDDKVGFRWANIPGAEEWEVEWQFIEYNSTWAAIPNATSYLINPSSCAINFKNNATRMRISKYNTPAAGWGFATPSPYIDLPAIYESGYVVFRVRPIGRDLVTFNEIVGPWSMGDKTTSNNLGTLPNAYNLNNYNEDLNWQRNVSFAEEGKFKNVISYYDGALRNRQSVTLNTSDNTPIIGQTFYDHIGRPTIQVLPTPALDNNSNSCFRPNFNKGIGSTSAYNYQNFDLTTANVCPGDLKVTEMDNSSGATKYYSANGFNATTMQPWQAFVPDAQGYPFTQVEFMPDNTGRVARQSGVGLKHRLTGVNQINAPVSGKETQFLYGKPFQEQLYRLFGNEVGQAEHYKRNVTIDPNGQASVTYIDAYGRTVATALAGDPANSPALTPLASSNQSFNYTITSFNNKADNFRHAKTIEHTIVVTDDNTYTIDYSVDPSTFILACTPEGICYDCVYDMQLSLTDACGVEMIPLAKRSAMVGNVKPFDLTCNAVTFNLAPNAGGLQMLLTKGTYRLTKTLTVNKEAMDYYKEEMWKNNTCLKTFEEFLAEEKAKLNLKNKCIYTCVDCKEDLTKYNDRKTVLTNKGNARTEAENSELLGLDHLIAEQTEMCEELCDNPTPCKLLLENILTDVAVYGQYAPTTKYDETTQLETSALNDMYNLLNDDPNRGWIPGKDWRHPLNPQINGSTLDAYYNENGTQAFIMVVNGLPELATGKKYYDANGNEWTSTSIGSRYIKPHELKNVDDFIKLFVPSWAHSLKYYHPEYCYYEKCNYVEATYKYNNKLLAEDDAAEAMKKGYYNPMNFQILNNNNPVAQTPHYYHASETGTLDKEPIYPDITSGLAHTQAEWYDHFYHYSPTGVNGQYVSIWDIYNNMVAAANLTTADKNCVGDAQWPLLRALYISAKNDLLKDYYLDAGNCGTINLSAKCKDGNCIGGVSIPEGKLLRFPLDAGGLNTQLAFNPGTNANTFDNGKTYTDDQVKTLCTERCESYASYWKTQLEKCNIFNGLSTTAQADLITDLKKVCELGCDENNLLGSREVPLYRYKDLNGAPENFYQVLEKHLGTPGSSSWFSAGLCDDIVLEWPMDYGHDYTAYDGPYADTCACKKKNYATSNPNCEGGNIPSPLENCACDIKNPEVRQAALMKLEIPQELKCQNCVDCKQFNEGYAAFITKYSKTVVTNMNDEVFKDLLTKSMNLYLGFNLDYEAYLGFAGQCAHITTPSRTTFNGFDQMHFSMLEKPASAPRIDDNSQYGNELYLVEGGKLKQDERGDFSIHSNFTNWNTRNDSASSSLSNRNTRNDNASSNFANWNTRNDNAYSNFANWNTHNDSTFSNSVNWNKGNNDQSATVMSSVFVPKNVSRHETFNIQATETFTDYLWASAEENFIPAPLAPTTPPPSANAERLACNCEKLLTARWYTQNRNNDGLDDLARYNQMYGSSPFGSQASFDNAYKVCCNAFNKNIPAAADCNTTTFIPGSKFDNSQKDYFDQKVLGNQSSPTIISSDYQPLLDNNCTNPLTDNNTLEKLDKCACEKLMDAKRLYETQYGPNYMGLPSFDAYIYQTYQVSGADFKALTKRCEDFWQSGAGMDRNRNKRLWPGLNANWKPVSLENLGQDAADEDLKVPKGLLCGPPPPPPCKPWLPSCMTMKWILSEFLANNAPPAGIDVGPYAPGDANLPGYVFYGGWEKFYESYMSHKSSPNPDPAHTAFYNAFAAFANTQTMVKAPCATANFSTEELIQSFYACLPLPCGPDCKDFETTFNLIKERQLLKSPRALGFSESTTWSKEWYTLIKDNYYAKDAATLDYIADYVQEFNTLIHTRCAKDNREYTFIDIWSWMQQCFIWPGYNKPPPPAILPPKCTSCYTVDYDYLKAFQNFLNQINRGSNTYTPNPLINKLGYTDWFLIDLPNIDVTQFYNSKLYLPNTNGMQLMYEINQNNYKMPYMEVNVSDITNFGLGFTLQFSQDEDIYNYGYIKEFKNIKPLKRIGCGLAKGYEVDAKIIIPDAYTGKGTIKTIKMHGVFYQGGYAAYTNCWDTCVRLCNKPQITAPVIEDDPCDQMLSREAYANALHKFETYKDEKNKKFEADYIAHCMGVTENFSLKFNQREYHYTLYYYDQAGNLIKTVPPEGVDITNAYMTKTCPGARGTLTTNALQQAFGDERIKAAKDCVDPNINGPRAVTAHSLITNYKYNTLNQLIWQSTPDGGESRFWYDNMGRLTVSQNAKQLAAGKYSYTLYDAFGRIQEVGEKATTSSMDYAIAGNITQMGSFLNSGTNRQVTRTFYDVLTRDPSNPIDPVNSVFKTSTRQFLRHRVVSTHYYANTPPSPFGQYQGYGSDAATHYSYDIHGNVDELVQDIAALAPTNQRYKKIAYNYDLLSGKVNQVHYQTGQADQMHHRYAYDADNRLTLAETSTDGWNYTLDAKYFYYLHGPLARTELGDYNQKVQGLDYAYTLHGWLKSVNGAALNYQKDMGKDGYYTLTNNANASFGRDAFGFMLHYYDGDYSPVGGTASNFMPALGGSNLQANKTDLYNGNIPFMQTSLPNVSSYNTSGAMVNNSLGNVYKYDQLNRLVEHKVFENFDNSTHAWLNNPATMGTDKYYENFTYDANGNILNLNRNGHNVGSTQGMDNFTYRYNNDVSQQVYPSATSTGYCLYPMRSNKLYHVNDAVAAANYTEDIDDQNTYNATQSTINTANNYGYDEIGNLVRDNAEGIQTIAWNVYGKIESITRTGSNNKPNLVYTYDAAGQRISKTVIPRTSGVISPQKDWVTTYYLRDATGNVMATYNQTYTELIANQTIKEEIKLKELHLYASSRLGVNNANAVMATQEYSISGYNTTTKSFVNQSVMVNTLVSTTVPSLPTIYTVTKGKKQYELSNHLGNVLATISDRRIPRDDNGDLFVDYFNPDIYSTNDYYAFGSPLPGRQGIQKCSMVNVSTNVTNYAAQENFSSGSTGGFVAGTGNRNVSNPTGNVLHLEAFWTTRPLANKTVAVTAGTTYTLNTDIVGFSTVAGYSHTVRIRVIGGGLSTIIANYTSTGAITPITFTPTATGNITIEISSVITGSGTYNINPYIDIDNFSVTYISTTTSSVLACTPLEGYRYNFNGKETDSETGLQDYGFRIYNPWLGKFLSVDPLTSKYPWLTPYQFASNTPIWAIDVDGLEASVNSDPANQSATPTREEYNKYCSNWKNMGLAYCLNGFNHTTQIMVNDNTICKNPVMESAAITAKMEVANQNNGRPKVPVEIAKTSWAMQNRKIGDDAKGIDGIQNLLDVGGNVPVFGEVLDGVNGVIYAARGDKFNAGASFACMIPVFGSGISMGKLTVKEGLANSKKLGILGEEAVGVGGKTRIESLSGTARYRVPDILTETSLEEIKNVKNLSFTRQLNDYHLYCKLNKLDFILWTRPNTTFSKPLQNAIDNCSIIQKVIPFK